MYPRDITCPACNAQPGHPCTQPTDNDRRTVTWFHFAREAAATKENPTHADS